MGDTNTSSKKKGGKKPAQQVVLPTPPDGGWGWMIVFSSFIVHIIADGVAYSFGIFCIEFIDEFNASRADVGWIGSMMIGITWGSGPIASALTNRYGCRAVTIAGSVVASAGFIISIFSPNIYFMYFSYGVVGGLGLGLIYLPAIVSVTYYFEKRRSFATGLAVCGSGIGTFIFAPFTKLLVKEYGWRGASLISAGILLNCIICGALFRPLELSESDVRKVEVELEEMDKMLPEKDSEETKANGTVHAVPNGDSKSPVKLPEVVIPVRRTASSTDAYKSLPSIDQTGEHETGLRRHASEDLLRRVQSNSVSKPVGSTEHVGPMYRKDIFYRASLQNIPLYKSNPNMYTASIRSLPDLVGEDETEERCCECSPEMKDALRSMTDFSLLKDPIFFMFAISNFFTSIGFCVPYLYLPDRAELMGISSDRAAFLISVIGIANTLGRITFGWLSDRPWVNRLMLYNTALFICGVCTALSAFCNNFEWMVAYAASFGMFLGVYVSLTSVVLVDLLGLECLTNSFGITLLFQGVAAVVGTPIAGVVYDQTGDYDYSFYLMGAIIGLSGFMLYFIPLVRRWQERRHPELMSQHEADMGRKASTTPQHHALTNEEV